MKKLLSVAVICFVAATLVGCGGSSAAPAAKATGTSTAPSTPK